MTSNVTTTTGTSAAPSSGSIAAPSSGWTDVTLFSSSYGKLQFDNLIASRDSTSLSLLTRSKESTKTKVARCRGSVPCGTCATFIVMGYTNTLCSLAGRPHTPQRRDHVVHPTMNEADLIKKDTLLDPLEDDDDIEWKTC